MAAFAGDVDGGFGREGRLSACRVTSARRHEGACRREVGEITGHVVAIQIHAAARADDAHSAHRMNARFVSTRQLQVEVRHAEVKINAGLCPVALDVEESVPRPRPAALEGPADVAFDLVKSVAPVALGNFITVSRRDFATTNLNPSA